MNSHAASSYLDTFVNPVYPPLPHITEVNIHKNIVEIIIHANSVSYRKWKTATLKRSTFLIFIPLIFSSFSLTHSSPKHVSKNTSQSVPVMFRISYATESVSALD